MLLINIREQVFVWRSKTFQLVIIDHLLNNYYGRHSTEIGVGVREGMSEGQDPKEL